MARTGKGLSGRSARVQGARRCRQARPHLLAPLLLAAVALCVAAAPASAVIVHLKNGRAVSYQPLRRAATIKPYDQFFTNLDYSGGPVMTSNTNYIIYWRPTGGGIKAYPAEYKPGLKQYFEDLAHDSGGHQNADSVSTQYNDTAGEFANYDSHFGGEFEDTDPYPPNSCSAAPICIDDEQIQAELVKFAKAQGLTMDLAHEFFLVTPPEVEDCFEAGGKECSAGSLFPEYCAYHSAVALEGGVLIYANDPYVTGIEGCDDGNHPNGKPSDGLIEGGLSHEHNESITDPEPNGGWTDWGEFFTGEIGDKCRTFEEATEFGTPLGEVEVGGKKYKYNQEINGHKYWYQQEWSNKGHQCLQRLNFSAGEAPAAAFSSASVAAGEAEFNATGSTSGSGVRYSWQFNDGVQGETETIETKSLTIKHVFPFAGVYLVALTVLTSNGTSKGTAHLVTVPNSQQIRFTSTEPGSASVGGPAYAVTAVGGGSGNPVTFTIGAAASAVCGISGASVSFIGVGNCVIDANQAGDAEYLAAPQVKQEFIVGRGSQEIQFTSTPPSTTRVGGPNYVAAATGGPSGNPVTFTIDAAASAICSISGTSVSFTGVGSCVIDANQPGSSLYNAAPEVQRSVLVAPAPNSSFSHATTSANASTGAITVHVSIANPGTLSWLATFANGRFGVFSARTSNCRRGYVRLAGRCRPARIVYAKGSAKASAAGTLTITFKPSASGRRALANAARRHTGVVVTLRLTFQSALGGAPRSSTVSLTVKLKKK